MSAPVAVVAIGNPYRGDDGAGSVVLGHLAKRLGSDERVRLADLDGEPVRVVQAWEAARAVWVVDAVRSDEAPGTVHGRDIGELRARGASLRGGHALGLLDAVELARALDRLPAELRVVGIEGACFDNGCGLTPEVAQAARWVADRLAREITEWLARHETTDTPGATREPSA